MKKENPIKVVWKKNSSKHSTSKEENSIEVA